VERVEPTARASVPELLRSHERLLASGTAAYRVGIVGERALTFGVGVPADRPYLRRANGAGVSAYRRSTGGTGVLLLASDVTWAIVLPRTDRRVGRDFVRAYPRLGRGVVTALGRYGIDARWVAAPGLVDDYCPLSSRGEVLEARGAIVGAAAQHLTSSALLHAGFVSWTVDRAEVDRLFGLPVEGPSARLSGVGPFAPGLTPERLAGSVARALADELGSSLPR